MPCNECPDSLEVNPNDGCLDPITSDCITYTGPAIPCLTITTGSSLETVIDLLSDAICTLQDEQFTWNCNLLSTCSINSLSDVVTTTPEVGQYLTWNGSNWVNTTLSIPDTFECSDLNSCDISALGNVNASSPNAGDVLTWNSEINQWTSQAIPESEFDFDCNSLSACSIDALSDVITDTPSGGDVLVWNGDSWENSTDLADLINLVNTQQTQIDELSSQINYLLEHIFDCCTPSAAEGLDANFSTSELEIGLATTLVGNPLQIGKVVGTLHINYTGTDVSSIVETQAVNIFTSATGTTKYQGYGVGVKTGENPSYDIQLLEFQSPAIETGIGTNTITFTVKFLDSATPYWVDITFDISGLVNILDGGSTIILPVTSYSVYEL
jgi:hypothetical protein